MKGTDLVHLEEEELLHKLEELREAIGKLRFKSATDEVDNPGRVRQQKRDMARILTELRRRELDRTPGGRPAAITEAGS